ncbi:hypothetical protein ACQJBY_032463 [Aegilops geniculata]
MAEKVGEDDPDRAREAVRPRRDASPTRSVQSIDRVNPEAPSWTKRCEVKSSLILNCFSSATYASYMQSAFFFRKVVYLVSHLAYRTTDINIQDASEMTDLKMSMYVFKNSGFV